MSDSPPDNPSQMPQSPEEDNLPELSSGSLIQLFIESFFMLGRYFLIVYPVFLYFILSSLFIPRAVPDFNHWAWWVIGLGWLVIFYLFKAGWNVMMFNAVQEWQTLKEKVIANTATPEEFQRVPFGLLKDFIPGIGQYGLSFLLGGIFWLLLTMLPVALLAWVGYTYIGIPKFVTTLMGRTDTTPAQIQQILETLNAVERAQMDNWNLLFWAMIVLLALVNGLTLFWQQYLVIKQCNPFKAFFYSIRHALRHPIKTFIIFFYFTFFYLSFSLMVNLSSFIAFFASFLLILTMVFFGLFMYLYLIRVDVLPENA